MSQKSVRDRTKPLVDKFKRRMREQENSSGTVVEPTEIDMLLTDIRAETEEAAEKYDSLNTKQKELEKSSRENAEVIRTVAMENLSDTQKRKRLVGDDSPISSKKHRNTGTETFSFLMNLN